MTMARLAAAVILALVASAAVGSSAFAQATPPATAPGAPKDDPTPDTRKDPADPMVDARRDYKSFFGGATTDRDQPVGLRLDAALFGAWDENLLAEFAGPNTTSVLQVSGAYTNVVGDLRYVRRTSRVELAATGGLGARYYRNLNKFAANDFHGGGGATVRLDRFTTIGLNQTLSYAPVYLFGLFADALPPELGGGATPNSSFAVNDDRAFTTDTRADAERRLSLRSLVSARASYRRSHFTVVTPRGTDFVGVDAGGDYRYRVTENGDIRLGYFYRNAQFVGAASASQATQPVEHNLHAGFSFHPTLSEERRTIVTFEGGTSLVNGALASNVTETRRQVRLVGDVAVAHQSGRTWLTVLAGKRGTGLVEGLSGPVFTDAVSATVTGFINERTDLYASVGYSNGEPTLAGAVQTFSTATAEARLRVALTTHWALMAQYVFYQYDFTKVIDLAAGLEPRVKRNTLRVGVNVWWPLR